MSVQEIGALSLIITAILGIWKIIQYLKDQPNLEVEVSYHKLAWTVESASKCWTPIYRIVLISKGKDPLKIEKCGFQFDDGNRRTSPGVDLSEPLGRFQERLIDPSFEDIEKEKVHYVWVRAGGRDWYSKKRPFRVNRLRFS